MADTATRVPTLKAMYFDEIQGRLKDELGFDNVMEVPKLEKISVNMGVGEAALNKRALEGAMDDLAVITGQRPAPTRAKKSLASFKLREGQSVGCRVTLRGDRMYEFLDRLISLAIPRIRDFRGLSPRSFDGNGNYTFGVTEQLIFPEINYDRVDTVRGMDITIVTTATTNEHGMALLDAFGFPFRKVGQ
jgi:large subunit ribosomal protein L5